MGIYVFVQHKVWHCLTALLYFEVWVYIGKQVRIKVSFSVSERLISVRWKLPELLWLKLLCPGELRWTNGQKQRGMHSVEILLLPLSLYFSHRQLVKLVFSTVKDSRTVNRVHLISQLNLYVRRWQDFYRRWFEKRMRVPLLAKLLKWISLVYLPPPSSLLQLPLKQRKGRGVV